LACYTPIEISGPYWASVLVVDHVAGGVIPDIDQAALPRNCMLDVVDIGIKGDCENRDIVGSVPPPLFEDKDNQYIPGCKTKLKPGSVFTPVVVAIIVLVDSSLVAG